MCVYLGLVLLITTLHHHHHHHHHQYCDRVMCVQIFSCCLHTTIIFAETEAKLKRRLGSVVSSWVGHCCGQLSYIIYYLDTFPFKGAGRRE